MGLRMGANAAQLIWLCPFCNPFLPLRVHLGRMHVKSMDISNKQMKIMYMQQEEKGNELERVHPFAHRLYGNKSHHHSSIRIILFSLGINQPPLCLTSGLGPRSPLQNRMGWHIYCCKALA